MDRRIVHPSRGVGIGLPIFLFVVPILGMAPMMYWAWDMSVRHPGLFSFPWWMLLYPVFMLLLTVWIWWSSRTEEWHFTDDEFMPGRGPLRFTGFSLPWSQITQLTVTPARAPFAGTRIAMNILCAHGYARRPYVFMPGRAPEGVALTVLGEFLGHVQPGRVDLKVVVLEDLIRGASVLDSSVDRDLAKACKALASVRLDRAVVHLKRFLRSTPPSDPRVPAANLLLAQSLVLLDRRKHATAASEIALQSMPTSNEARLCAAMAAVRAKDVETATALLTGMTAERHQALIDGAVGMLETTGRVAEKPRVNWPILILAIVAIILVNAPGFVSADMFGSARTFRMVSWALAGAAFGGMVIMWCAQIIQSARAQRKASPAQTVRPVQVSPVAAAAHPEDRVHAIARVAAWISVIAFVLGFGVIAALQLVGTFAPQILAGSSGEIFAQRTFNDMAIGLIIVSALTMMWAVQNGALKSQARTQAGPVVTSVPVTRAEDPMPTSGWLNVSLGTGWIVAAIGTAVVCAGVALFLAGWDPPMLGHVTTDTQGNIYATLGPSVRRWDIQGEQTLQVDLDAGAREIERPTDLAVTEAGDIYVADGDKHRVIAFASDGTYLGECATGVTPLSSDVGSWEISMTDYAEGVLVMDGGRVIAMKVGEGIDEVGTNPDMYWAYGIDTAGDVSYVCDTNRGCVQRIEADGDTTRLSCLALPDGYRYPERVQVAPDGSVYAIVRKAWNYDEDASAGQPLADYRRANIWMGKIARIDFEASTAQLLPITFGERELNIADLAFLPDGGLIVMPLNEERLYYVKDPSTGDALHIAFGELGEQLGKTDMNFRVTWVGPQLFAALAVGFPIGIGITGAFASRRKRIL